MRKFFTISHNQITILLTLLVVILLGVTYRFVYIPNREHKTQENHFRALQRLETNIEEKLENMVGMLSNLLDPFVDVVKDSSESKAQDVPIVKEFITKNNQSFAWKNFSISAVKGDSINALKEKYPDAYTTFMKSDKRDYRELHIDSVLKSFAVTVIKKKKDSCYLISLNTSYNQFFSPVLNKDIFDQYIIFSDADPIYETFSSGVTYSKYDSAVHQNKEIQSSSVKDLSIGGVDYRMFLQPMHFDVTHHWVIGGLLRNVRYTAETRKLPTGLILLLATSAIIIIVAFPLLKLFQMGRNNLLTLGDGIFSIMVSILLMALLFFVFFRYNGLFRHSNDSVQKRADITLADKIKEAFLYEVNLRYDQLCRLDSLMAANNKSGADSGYRTTIVDVKDFHFLKKGTNNRGNVSTSDSVSAMHERVVQMVDTIMKKPAFEKMFWIDKGAREHFYWNNNRYYEPHVYNLWRREYFRSIVQGRQFYLNNDPSKPFCIDQVMSRVDGNFRSVISKPSYANTDILKVAALGFNMQSLSRVLLPAGYSFAITDVNGKVLYFSDSTRNLNENLLEEFSEAGNLQQAFSSRTTEFFRTDYYGKRYSVYAKPITSYLPYYIIIFSDTVFKSTRDFEVFSFTVSMLFLFFLLVIIQIAITLFATYKKIRIPKKHFITNWLWPKPQYHADYNIVTIANVLIICLLLIVFDYVGFPVYLFSILIGVTVSVFLPVFLAVKKSGGVLYYKLLTSCLFFIIMANIACIAFFGWSIAFTLIEAGIIIIGLIVYKARDRFDGHREDSKWSYIHSYTLMNTTRLIITSGIPVVLFYVTSFNYEQGILARYRQLSFTDELLKKAPKIFSVKLPCNSCPPSYFDSSGLFDFYIGKNKNRMEKISVAKNAQFEYKGAVYTDSNWINEIGISNTVGQEPSFKENRTHQLLNLFRYYETKESDAQDNLYYTSSADSLFRYDGSLVLEPGHKFVNSNFYRQLWIGNNNDSMFLVVNSLPKLYQLPKVFSLGIIFWVVFAIALICFYAMMLTITKKLFAYDFKKFEETDMLQDILLGKKGLSQSLFIVNLAEEEFLKAFFNAMNAGKLFLENSSPAKGKEILKTGTNDDGNFTVVDFMNLPDSKNNQSKRWAWQKNAQDTLQGHYKCVLIKNFEYNSVNAITHYERVNFLEKVAVNDVIVIITSATHPNQLDSIFPSTDNEKTKATIKLNEYRLRLQAVLQHYTVVYCPLMHRKHHLYTEPEIEQLYQYLWNSFSDGEKFILYDLAKDGLVNVHDDSSIRILISKGVISCDAGNRFIFFDWKFKDFILKMMSGEGISVIQSHIEDNGNWNKLKIPLMIVICGVLLLLFISQEGAFSRFIGFIGAIATGIPAVMRLFSIFEKTERKP